MTMKVLRHKKEITAFLKLLKARAAGVSPEITERVKGILLDIRKRGDTALQKYTRKFDRHDLPAAVSEAEVKGYAGQVDRDVKHALEVSIARIREFHMRQVERSWSFKKDGALLGQIIKPIERVGIYVPGGKASYPSTVLMNVIPAQVAGVPEIALCVPAPLGKTDPYVMAAIDLLGVREIYRIGGAQAIGAMAYGSENIKKVDKIVGPGNIYVALAKKMVFGDVGIDMIAGPTEILIIADETADPAFVAADMLSQAEHDEMASSILITSSEGLIEKILPELNRQMKMMKRRDIARRSLRRYGAIISVKGIREAMAIANEIAPEHLEIMTREPEKDVELVTSAGAIFLGQWTPESLGDYSAGPNHTLPTGGSARFSSPLGVYDFIKRTSLLTFDKEGFMLLASAVEALAGAEGLEAHGNAVKIRKSV